MKPAAFAYAKARSLDHAIALLGEHHGEAICGKDFRRTLAELIGKKPPIITDDDPLLRAGGGICLPIVRRGLADPVKVGKSKVPGNNGPPAIGSKFNRCHTT